MVLSLIVDEAPFPLHRGGPVAEPSGKRRCLLVPPTRLELKRERVVFNLPDKRGLTFGPVMPASPRHVLRVLLERAANRVGISTEIGIQVNQPCARHVRGFDLR